MQNKNNLRILKKLLAISMLAICLHMENVQSELSDAVVNDINAPLLAAGINPAILGAIIPGPISRSRANLSAIMYRAARIIGGAAVAPVVIGGINPGAVAIGHINFNNAAQASEQTIAGAIGINPAIAVLSNAAPAAGIFNREINLFRKLVNVRHLWKWPAAIPANQNLNYLAWCRAARVENGIPGAGTHTSFFVPAGINANVYFVELLNRIATEAAGAGNMTVSDNGVLIAGPAVLGGAALAPHFAPAPPVGHIVQIFVNIGGAAHIGGAPIRGIKCNLAGGPLPVALSAPAPLAPAFAAAAVPIQLQLEATTSKREALYTEAMTSIPGAAAIGAAFVALHGGGALTSAAAPQNVNVVEIRIQSTPAGAVSISLYPI